MADAAPPADLTPAVLAQVKPSILSILRSSDLQQVSAKKVRVQLNDDGLLTRLGVDMTYKPHKAALDEEIRAAFGQVDAEVKARETKPHSSTSGYANGSSSSSSTATPVDRKPVGIALPGGGVRGDSSASDAAMAAALQRQFNADAGTSRATRGAASSTPRKGKAAAGKKRKLKGEDTISSDEEDGSILEGGTPKKKKKATKKKKKGDGEEKPKNPNNPFNKPVVLSPLMAEICGGDEVSNVALCCDAMLGGQRV